jgi:hypothetical protein
MEVGYKNYKTLRTEVTFLIISIFIKQEMPMNDM